jgi:hypothetical protein
MDTDTTTQTTPDEDISHVNRYREQYSYYARQLLSDLGLGDLGQPERGQLLLAIEEYVEKVITNALLENLTEEQIDAADTIMARGGGQEEIIVHLLETTPDIELKIADALTTTYASMLDESRQLASAIVKHSSKSTDSTDTDTQGA